MSDFDWVNFTHEMAVKELRRLHRNIERLDTRHDGDVEVVKAAEACARKHQERAEKLEAECARWFERHSRLSAENSALVTALEEIAGCAGRTLLGCSCDNYMHCTCGETAYKAHEHGANKAFEQCAAIAKAAVSTERSP